MEVLHGVGVWVEGLKERKTSHFPIWAASSTKSQSKDRTKSEQMFAPVVLAGRLPRVLKK